MSGMGKTEGTNGVNSGAGSSILTRGDVVEVTIEKLVSGGDGLARHEGLPIFVARTAPGDRARVKVASRKPSYARAEVVEILDPGAGRREPPCRHFGQCGGCDLQHLEDELQLEYKVAATLETLGRIGGVELPEHEVIAGSAWGYRGRTQLHVGPSLEGRGSGGPSAITSGAATASSRCANARCWCRISRASPVASGPALPARSAVPRRSCGGRRRSSHRRTADRGSTSRRGDCGRSRLRLRLRRALLLPGESGPLGAPRGSRGRRGVGRPRGGLVRRRGALRAAAWLSATSKVVAVEGDRLAARYGRINVRRNSALNVDVVHQAVESWIPELSPSCDRVVVDPPRSGLLRPILAALVSRRPAALTYVSCHPAALARDLRALDEAYAIRALTMLDLFPQTGHIEVVAQLVARTRSSVTAAADPAA